MRLVSGVLLLSLVTILGCAQQREEPKSVRIDFTVKGANGESKRYNKIIPFSTILENYHYVYECKLYSNDGVLYRLAFWSHLYPLLPVEAVEIRYDLGNSVSGNGLAMPAKFFSVYDKNAEASMMVDIFSTRFLDYEKEQFPQFYKENLDCQRTTAN